MSTTASILIAAAVILVAAAAWWVYRQQRAKQLKRQFGPEYTHAVQQYGSEFRAQDALSARTRRMEKIHVRLLSREDHDRFQERWETVQRHFVDDPAASIQQADLLVNELMRARGYPMADFEHRAEDISVGHPEVVQNYRLAHAIAQRHERGRANTEDLRQGLVHYRALFGELLERHLVSEGRTGR
jgi:hypothetical protein